MITITIEIYHRTKIFSIYAYRFTILKNQTNGRQSGGHKHGMMNMFCSIMVKKREDKFVKKTKFKL